MIQRLEDWQPERMGILKEFLDSSTIHGLAYISNPKVNSYSFCFLPSLKEQCCGQALLDSDCCGGISRSGFPYRQFLPWMAGVSNSDDDHDPSFGRPWLPCCDSLPSSRLQHGTQLRPHADEQFQRLFFWTATKEAQKCNQRKPGRKATPRLCQAYAGSSAKSKP